MMILLDFSLKVFLISILVFGVAYIYEIIIIEIQDILKAHADRKLNG